MCETKKLHELYEECKRMNFTDSSELVESAQSAEEADFFAKVCDIILQQKQDKVVETNRFQLPKFIVFAGPNGCGKSTLFHTNRDVFDIPRINVDEIVRENGGDWRNSADLMHAGRLALKRLKSCMEKMESFNQETTLCGNSVLQNIQRAHNLGYEVELYFVCVENVELAKTRIRKRVAAGGHGIPDADVERRYTESLQKLKSAIPLCQKVELYDNTEKFRKIATLKNGRASYLAEEIPEWAKTFV